MLDAAREITLFVKKKVRDGLRRDRILPCIFLCFLLVVSSFADKDTDKIFRQSLSYYTENGTQALTGGDLDGDGDIDLVTANLKTSEVPLFLNRGDGAFRWSARYSVYNGPLALCLGDLDGDGDLDLAVLCFSAGKVSVLLNRGKASFTVAATFDVSGTPFDLCIGDFNNDGKTDLATANSNSGDISILVNEGGMKFSEAQRYRLPGKPYRLLCGDFNGDAKADLVATSGKEIYILLNSGAETPFADHKTCDAGGGIRALAAGDLDGDGDLDLATANAASDVWVFLNTGNGSLQREGGYKAGDSPQYLVVMDVNRDSRPDLVTANKKSRDLSVFFNIQDGHFAEGVRYELRAVPSAMYAADLDSDKDVDLALVSDGSALAVLINTYGEK